MKLFILIFLLFFSGSMIISLFFALTKLMLAGWLLSRVGNHWQQYNNYFDKLSRMIADYGARGHERRKDSGISKKLNYQLLKMQDKMHYLTKDQRQEAQMMRSVLLEDAEAAGLSLMRS